MANSAYIAELGICFQAQHMAGTAGGDRLIQEVLLELGQDEGPKKIPDNVKRFDQGPARRGRVHDTEWLLFCCIEECFFAAVARNV